MSGLLGDLHGRPQWPRSCHRRSRWRLSIVTDVRQALECRHRNLPTGDRAWEPPFDARAPSNATDVTGLWFVEGVVED
jgi:hypothetical protein